MANLTRERRLQLQREREVTPEPIRTEETAPKRRGGRRPKMTWGDMIPLLNQCEVLAEEGATPAEIAERVRMPEKELHDRLNKAGYALRPVRWELNYNTVGYVPKAALRQAGEPVEE